VVSASTFATRTPTNQRLVNLDRVFPSDGVAVVSHHSGSQLVKGLESCLIPADIKLALRLEGGLPWRLGRHEIRGPEPQRAWPVAGLHDAACRKRHIRLATSAPEDNKKQGSAIRALVHQKITMPSGLFFQTVLPQLR